MYFKMYSGVGLAVPPVKKSYQLCCCFLLRFHVFCLPSLTAVTPTYSTRLTSVLISSPRQHGNLITVPS